ncbi:MAG: ABC transporter permease [Armatimonadota bacterium]
MTDTSLIKKATPISPDLPMTKIDLILQHLPRLAGVSAIMRKELRTQQRQMRVWWRQLLQMSFILACFGWLLMCVFPIGNAISDFSFNNGIDLSFYIRIAWSLLLLLVLAQVVPAIAGAIAHEREAGTLEMLLLTPLRSSEILAGKALAACLPVVTMLAVIIIFMVVGMRISDNYAWDVIEPLMILCRVALFATVLGLFCSTWLDRTASVIGITIAGVVSKYLSFLLAPWIGWGDPLYHFDEAILTLKHIVTGIILAIATMALINKGISRKGKPLPGLPYQIALGLTLGLPLSGIALSIGALDGDSFTSEFLSFLFNPDGVVMSGEMIILFILAVTRLNTMRRV